MSVRATYLLSSAATTVVLALVGFGIAAVAAGRFITGAWLPVTCAAGLMLVPAAVSAIRGRWDIFEPVHLFALAFGVLFVARPAFDLSSPATALNWLGYDISGSYRAALFIAVAGGVAFYLGYYLRVGRAIANRVPLPRAAWSEATFDGVVSAIVVVVALLFGAFLASRGAGALAALTSGRSAARLSTLETTSGYLYTAPLWLTSLGIILLARSPRWLAGRGLLGLVLIALSQVTSIGGGNRSWTLPAILALILLWYLRQDRRPSARVVTFVLAVVFLFGIVVPREERNVTYTNRSFTYLSKQAVEHPLRAVSQFFQGADTGMAPDLAVEVGNMPTLVQRTNGSTYLDALARPVPRAIWHNKPIAADQLLMQRLWPSFASMHVGFSFSFFGEPYLNFGLAGVLFISFAFGAGWRALYEWLLRDRTNPTVISIFAITWPFLIVYMRGGLGVDYSRQMISTAPLLLVILLVRRRSARHAAAPALVASTARGMK